MYIYIHINAEVKLSRGSVEDITARIKKAKAIFQNYHPFGNQSKSL
jgi:hypothetical protein